MSVYQNSNEIAKRNVITVFILSLFILISTGDLKASWTVPITRHIHKDLSKLKHKLFTENYF